MPIPAERLSQCSHTRSRRILEPIISSVPWLNLQMCVWDSETETWECVGTWKWWCQFSVRLKNVLNKMRERAKQGNNSRKSSSLPSGFSQQFRLHLHWQKDIDRLIETVCLRLWLTFTFSRRFYPKRLTLHSSYSFYILSALAFPGNRTHDLGVANAMLYQLSYRKAFKDLHTH